MRRAAVIAAVAVTTAAGVWVVRRGDTGRTDAVAPASSVTEEAPSPPPVPRPPAPPSAPRAAATDGEPAPITTAPAPDEAEGEEAGASDALAAVREAKRSDTDASTAVLMRALDSDDSPAKLEAIDELVRRKHGPALGRLLKMDPADDPFVGPTALLGVGQLAREADPASRDAAVTRLEKLLESEKARQGMDSPGNILVIFEALGRIASPSAARVLERELVDPAHGTAAKVAIVDAIEECGQRSSVSALAAFREGFQVTAQDAFEREIEADLVKAIDRAITELGRGS